MRSLTLPSHLQKYAHRGLKHHKAFSHLLGKGSLNDIIQHSMVGCGKHSMVGCGQVEKLTRKVKALRFRV